MVVKLQPPSFAHAGMYSLNHRRFNSPAVFSYWNARSHSRSVTPFSYGLVGVLWSGMV